MISNGDWPRMQTKGRMRGILVMMVRLTGDRRYLRRDQRDEDEAGNKENTYWIH